MIEKSIGSTISYQVDGCIPTTSNEIAVMGGAVLSPRTVITSGNVTRMAIHESDIT